MKVFHKNWLTKLSNWSRLLADSEIKVSIMYEKSEKCSKIMVVVMMVNEKNKALSDFILYHTMWTEAISNKILI